MDPDIHTFKEENSAHTGRIAKFLFDQMFTSVKALEEALNAGEDDEELLRLALLTPDPKTLKVLGWYRCMLFSKNRKLIGSYTGLAMAGVQNKAGLIGGLWRRNTDHERDWPATDKATFYRILRELRSRVLPHAEQLDAAPILDGARHIYVPLAVLEPEKHFTIVNGDFKFNIPWGDGVSSDLGKVRGLVGYAESVFIFGAYGQWFAVMSCKTDTYGLLCRGRSASRRTQTPGLAPGTQGCRARRLRFRRLQPRGRRGAARASA